MDRRIIAAVVACCVPIVIAGVTPLHAQWVENGVGACTAPGEQLDPKIVLSASGEAILVWLDDRNQDYNYDIYAAKVTKEGTVPWTANGIAISAAASSQILPAITADGTGGAIFTWQDNRSGNHIYAQRIDGSGAVQWTVDGIPLYSLSYGAERPAITTDMVGGAIVVWDDYRASNYNVYVQRVDPSGSAVWSINGNAMCTATGNQQYTQIVSDGIGGAIMVWRDERNGNQDIYAQRVGTDGVIMWSYNGVAVCTETSDQSEPRLVCDGGQGAIIAWRDMRNGNMDIYAQRVDASGSVQWTADGVSVCSYAQTQSMQAMAPDGSGGTIIVWHDYRNANYDIYAQRLNASGSALWTADGIGICTDTDMQANPAITTLDAGGAIISWADLRTDVADIYAQKIDANGTDQWATDGVPVCTAPNIQTYPALVVDEYGGAFVTWRDKRSIKEDIYVQRLESDGDWGFYPAPDIYNVRDVPGDEGGSVNVSWYASSVDPSPDHLITEYSIWRAIAPAAATLLIEQGAAVFDEDSGTDGKVLEPNSDVVRVQQFASETYFWKYIQSVDAAYLESYSDVVPTLFDSTDVCDEYHYFQVIAHTSDPYVFYTSDPDSGYSVDNLAPCPPACLVGQQSFTPEGLDITWRSNTEIDFDCYAVYRGLSEDFVPGPGNLVGEPCDTSYFDGGWQWNMGYWYKVAAVDIHGNESLYAVLGPDAVTGVETPGSSPAYFLAQNHPNPFNPVTTIRFGLKERGPARLSIYDAAGRLVRTLVDDTRPAGAYSIEWDGRDTEGRAVASGVYFYCLRADAFEQTRKMVLLK
jgi:predicted lipoprotein with Yx(FWY)xxD motif